MTAEENTAEIIRAEIRRVNALIDHAYEFRNRIANDLAFVDCKIENLSIEKAELMEKFNQLEK